MSDSRSRLGCVAGCLLALLAPALAAQDLSPGLGACRAEPDDAKRLACYDRLMAEPDALPPVTAAGAEERFGIEGELARSDRVQARKDGRELEEMHSTVARLATRPDGVLIITLENGQVWMPKEIDPNVNLRIGDPIRIRRGAMDSYVLNGRSKWSTRVRRLQ